MVWRWLLTAFSSIEVLMAPVRPASVQSVVDAVTSPKGFSVSRGALNPPVHVRSSVAEFAGVEGVNGTARFGAFVARFGDESALNGTVRQLNSGRVHRISDPVLDSLGLTLHSVGAPLGQVLRDPTLTTHFLAHGRVGNSVVIVQIRDSRTGNASIRDGSRRQHLASVRSVAADVARRARRAEGLP
mgnify:CR=1 FL=1